MLSLTAHDEIKILFHLPAPTPRPPPYRCFEAPSCCLFGFCTELPCVGMPKSIIEKQNASRYVYVRENSLEYNNPKIKVANGLCCGYSCSDYRVEDHVSVIYYDDPHFQSLTNGSRSCDDWVAFCCGSPGERIIVESRFCCGYCRRGEAPCCVWPVCCPISCGKGCVYYHSIRVDSADVAIARIEMVREERRKKMGYYVTERYEMDRS